MHYTFTRLREILEAEGEGAALAFASKLRCLGNRRDVIQKGYSAKSNPDFYRSLGINPEEAEREAVSAIREIVSEN